MMAAICTSMVALAQLTEPTYATAVPPLDVSKLATMDIPRRDNVADWVALELKFERSVSSFRRNCAASHRPKACLYIRTPAFCEAAARLGEAQPGFFMPLVFAQSCRTHGSCRVLATRSGRDPKALRAHRYWCSLPDTTIIVSSTAPPPLSSPCYGPAVADTTPTKEPSQAGPTT